MPSRRRLTDQQLEEMAELRTKNWSYRALGERYGIHPNAVSWQCLRLGADPSKPAKCWQAPRGPIVTKRGNHVVRRFTAEEDAQLLKLEAQGITVCEIARAMGRRWNSIRARLMTLARRDDRRERGAARAA